jgi:1,4-alpha-glucan branching enzyme
MEMSKPIKKVAIRSLLFLVYVLLCLLSFAQKEVGKCEFKNNEFTVEITKNAPADQLDNFIDRYDLKDLNLKTVFKTNNLSALKTKGWKIKLNTDKTLVITKSLTGSTNLSNPADNITITNAETSIAQRFPATGNGLVYGVNRFRNRNDFAVKNADVTFYLRSHLNAKNVILAGSFNGFSPDALHMKKTDSGWIVTVKLTPGKYWYKFIADGHWTVDDDNYLRENDGQGNTNSVYYKPNFLFEYKGLPNAKKAYVFGSFNNWKKTGLPMTKTATGWALPLYLADGTHTYKYLIDNTTYTDTDKFDKLPDGYGGYNSVVRFGKSHLFTLLGHTAARQVMLAGTFNGWRNYELAMKKTATGWQLPYTLGAGNYEYKFVVDGNWITDPTNPLKVAADGQPNSYLIVGANYTFRLKGAANAKAVRLAGDFNNWDPYILTMTRQADEWICSVYLSPGKHKYKFVVDGNWITDPANKNWEQNEFGTGNSVMWMEK